MKKVYCFLVIFFIGSTSAIFAQGAAASPVFDMISVGDPVLNDLRHLSLESGIPFLSFSPPLAPAEIRNFLERVDTAVLSESAMASYMRLEKRLTPEANISVRNGIYTFLFNVESTIEGRTSFNKKVAEHPENPNINPFITFPLRFSFANTVQLYVEPSFARRPNRYKLDTFDLNIPADYFFFDESTPLKAFAASGGDWWNFQIGRDRLFWGTGNTGSLSFSDNSQYFDFARFSLFSSGFKYSVIVNQLPLRLRENLLDTSLEGFKPDWGTDPDILKGTNQRYFYLHRMDVTVLNRVSISLMEGLMVGNGPLELRYLNPFVLFHSFNSWIYYDKWYPPYEGDNWRRYKGGEGNDMTGSFFSVEINWNIVKKLAVYGQFLMNEFAESGERQRDPHQPPNALGYIAGIQFTQPFAKWGSITFLEFVYTDPYLGILSSPFASFIQENRYSQYYFLGYPRDTMALTLGTRIFDGSALNFSGCFSWLARGEHNKHGLLWDWQMADGSKTPTGTVEHSFVLSVGADWQPLDWFIVRGSITGIMVSNNKHISGNFERGGQASFSVGFRY